MPPDPLRSWRSFQGSSNFQAFHEEMADVFIRIYRLDPHNYADNERAVKNEFERLASEARSAAERMQEMRKALDSLKITIADLETQGIQRPHADPYVINEEPELAWELLG